MTRTRILVTVACAFLMCFAASAFAAVTPQNVVVTTATTTAGGTVSFTFDLNVTVSPAAAANAVIRYSADATCSSTDTFLKYVPYASSGNTTPLSVGVHSYSNSATIPSGAPAGTRYLCVWAGTVTGNAASYTVASSTPVVTPNNADVIPTSALQGATVAFEFDLDVTVAPAPNANAVLRFSSDATCSSTDTFLKYVAYNTSGNVVPLSIGTHSYATTITIPSSAPTGTRYVCVFAGSLSASDSLTVTSNTPVVTPQNAFVAESSVPQGGTLTLDYQLVVSNAAAPSGNAVVRFDTDSNCTTGDAFLMNVPYPSQAVGTYPFNNVAVTISASTPVGTGRRLCVWVGSTLYAATNTFSVVAAASDVTPQDIKVFGPETTGLPEVEDVTPDPHIWPGTVIQGDSMTVTFDVYNHGNKASNAAYAIVRFHVDPVGLDPTACNTSDTFLAQVTVPAIAVNATASIEVPNLHIPSGTPTNMPHKICITVDSNSASGQTVAGKADDLGSEIVVVGALPDLVPVNITVTPVGPVATLDFEVYNQGRGGSSASHVRAFLSDLDYEHDFDDFVTYPNNVEIDLSDPCAPIAAKTSQVMGMGGSPSCIPTLASGASQSYSAQIPLSGDFGTWSYNAPWGGFSSLPGGGVHVNVAPFQWAYVTFTPGMYVWVVVDSEKVGGVGEAGQTLAELHSNDEQMIWANPWTVGNVSSLSFDFANVVSGPVAGGGYIGDANPVVGIGTGSGGQILGWFSGTDLAAVSGCAGELADATPRWDDLFWGWGDGAPSSPWADIQTRRGSESLEEINIYFNYFSNADDVYDLDVTGVNINQTCI